MEKDNKKQNANQENISKEDPEETSPDNIDDIPAEILEAIPEEERSRLVGLIKRSISVTRHASPFGDKVTSDHITKLIENSDSQDKRDRVERRGQRNYNLLILVIVLVFIVFLVVYFKDDKEVLIPLVTSILSFVAGAGFGVGLSKKRPD